MLSGISERRYAETLIDTAGAFGVSASSISNRIVEATSRKLKEFKERDLSELRVFAVFIDTVHRGGDAFIVSLGIDHEGHKHPLGFWQGATENSDICRELFADMQRRGLALSKKTLSGSPTAARGSSRPSQSDSAKSFCTSDARYTKIATSGGICPSGIAKWHTGAS